MSDDDSVMTADEFKVQGQIIGLKRDLTKLFDDLHVPYVVGMIALEEFKLEQMLAHCKDERTWES